LAGLGLTPLPGFGDPEPIYMITIEVSKSMMNRELGFVDRQII
jgi:hypothetical protein